MTQSTERAVLAGGCFWGMQDLIRRYPGVISTRVGYTGGDVPNATYRNHGTHAEAIDIIFDPSQLPRRTGAAAWQTRGSRQRSAAMSATRQRTGVPAHLFQGPSVIKIGGPRSSVTQRDDKELETLTAPNPVPYRQVS